MPCSGLNRATQLDILGGELEDDRGVRRPRAAGVVRDEVRRGCL